jgi:HEAT repeat protein
MQRPLWLAVAALASLVVAANAVAQPASADPRQRLRRDQDRPQNRQQFDEAMRKFRSDELPERLEGIAALGTVEREPRAIEYLLEAANDENPTVRVKAIDTLGSMRATAATPVLLQRIFLRDTDLATKRRILTALGRIGDQRATAPLLDLLGRDVPTELKASALYALGEIGDDAARPAIEAHAALDPSDPLAAVGKAALAKLKSRPAPVEVPSVLVGGPS